MATKPASKLYVVFVIFTIIIFIGTLIVQGVIMQDNDLQDLSKDLVENRTLDKDDLQRTQLGPASWAFSIWFVIFTWQAVFLIYCVLSLFPRFDLHRVPIAAFPFYSLANLGGSGWTVLSEKFDWFWPDFGSIALMPISLYICFIISIISLRGKPCKYFIYTYCVHNAWAIFAGWTSIAMLLWLAKSLSYADSPKMDVQMTTTVLFGVLMLELVIFCSLELTVFDKYLRHVWSHYLSLSIAMVGSIIRNWDPENRNTIMAVAIAGFLACSILSKLTRLLTSPGRPDQVKPTEEEKYKA